MAPDFKTIFVQRKIFEDFLWRGRAEKILARFPDADVREVDQHWRLPELAQAPAEDWLRTKKNVLVLGVKAGLTHRENGRSADYIAASLSNGCLSSCQYCYVARQKGTSNPLTIFVNVDEIADSIDEHQKKLGPKQIPNQCDPNLWVYDIGCNADLSLDARVCDHPQEMITRFTTMEHAKASFATKTVNEEAWLSVDPKGHTRIRYSLMPQRIAKSVDIRTSPIPDRIRSVNVLVDAGYEVHLNFSPIILYGDEQWKADWLDLFRAVDDVLSEKAKKQLACEAFLLSHAENAHQANMEWNPKGESFLWRPELQVPKPSKPDVLVYQPQLRREALRWFSDNLARVMPYCPIRYSF